MNLLKHVLGLPFRPLPMFAATAARPACSLAPGVTTAVVHGGRWCGWRQAARHLPYLFLSSPHSARKCHIRVLFQSQSLASSALITRADALPSACCHKVGHSDIMYLVESVKFLSTSQPRDFPPNARMRNAQPSPVRRGARAL